MSDTRNKRGRGLARWFALIPPLFLIASIGVYLVKLGHQIKNSIAQIVVEILAQQLQREIIIGNYSVSPDLSAIHLKRLRISNSHTFISGKNRALLDAAGVDVTLDVASLLSDPANAAAYIKTLKLTNPKIEIDRLSSAQYNFTNLIKKPSLKGKPLQAVIYVRNGLVRITDYAAPASIGVSHNTLTKINAAVDLSTAHQVSVNLSSTGIISHSGPVSLIGHFTSEFVKKGEFDRLVGYDLHLNATKIDAPYVYKYLMSNLSNIGRIDGGTANLQLVASQAEISPKPSLFGTAELSNATVVARDKTLLSSPISNINGRVDFTDHSVNIDSNASLSSQPFHLRLKVPSYNAKFVEFRIESSAVNLKQLHHSLSIAPQLPAWLTVTKPASLQLSGQGLFTHPDMQFAFTVPALSVYGTSLTNLKGIANYHQNLFELRQLVASSAGQSDNITLSAKIPTSTKEQGFVSGAASQVDLSSVSLPTAVSKAVGSLSGKLDVALTMPLTQLTSKPIPMILTARLQDATVHGVGIKEAAASLELKPDELTIDKLVAVDNSGALLSILGQMPLSHSTTQPYSLKLDIAGLDLSEFRQSGSKSNYTGLAYLKGGVAGEFGNPQFAGTIQLFGPGIDGYNFDQISGNIAANPSKITIQNGKIRKLGLLAQVDGTVDQYLSKSPQVNLTASTDNAELATISGITGDLLLGVPASKITDSQRSFQAALESASGAFQAKITAHGSLAKPNLTAAIKVPSGSVGGFDLENVILAARLNGNHAVLDHLSGVIDGTTFNANGSLNTTDHYFRATADISSPDIARLARSFQNAPNVIGTSTATISAYGKLSNPTISLMAAVPQLEYDGVEVSAKKVILTYNDGVVSNVGYPIIIESGPASYTIARLNADFKHKTVDLDSSVANERLGRVLSLFNRAMSLSSSASSTRIQSAVATAPIGTDAGITIPEIAVTGSFSNPSVSIQASLKDLTFGDSTQHTLDLNTAFTYGDGILSVTSFEGRGPVEYISGTGTLNTHGAIDGQLEASNIPLRFLQPFLPNHQLLDGDISDISIVASGTTRKPQIVGSLSVKDIAVQGVTLDRIDSGRITVADDKIDVAGISVVKNEIVPGQPLTQHVATVQGVIPFVFSLDRGLKAYFPSNAAVNLHAQLPEQSVSLFSLFASDLKAVKLAGTVAARLDLTGTLKNKVLQGSLDIKNGAIQPQGLATSYKNIEIHAQFDGHKGTLTSSNIVSSAGGSVNVGGTVDLVSDEGIQQYNNAEQALLGNIVLNLTADAVNFKVVEPKIADLLNAGAEGVINGRVTVTQSLLTPLLSGNVRVTQAVGILPSSTNSSTSITKPGVFNPQFNLAISIASGSRVKASQIEATADGSFSVKGSLNSPNVVGDVYLRRGRFNFPTASFQIVPVGIVHFVYNPPDPTIERVSITARTYITASPQLLNLNSSGFQGQDATSYNPSAFSSPTSSDSRRYQVTVTIEGDLNSPSGLTSTFTSSPAGLNESQILAALGGQEALNTLLIGGNVQRALQNEAQKIFINSLLPGVENGVAGFLGIDEFSIDYDPQSGLQLSPVVHLGYGLDLSYTQYFSSRTPGAVANTLQPPEYRVSLEYNLINRFRLYGSIDDQRNYTYGIERVYGF